MKDNIPGFMGYYVSKTGSVYSRYVRGSRGKLSNEFTPLIPKKRPKYYSVSLYRDGKSTKIFVHRFRNILNNSYENKESRGSKR